MRPYIFEVVYWPNKPIYLLDDMESERQIYDTLTCHYASSLENAKKWCKSHYNYGGVKGQTYDYVPWHFRIYTKLLDEDTCCESPSNVNDSFNYVKIVPKAKSKRKKKQRVRGLSS